MTKPMKKSSTSPDLPTPIPGISLSFADLGSEISLHGHDITLSRGRGEPRVYTGVLESLRMNVHEIVVVLLIQRKGMKFATPRVVRVEL